MPVYSCRYVGWYIQDKFPSVWRHCWSGHHWRGAWGTTIYRKNLRGGVCDTRKKYLLSYLPPGLMTTKLQLFRYTDDNLFAVPRESKESLGKTAHRTNGIDFAGANCIIYNSLAAMCILKKCNSRHRLFEMFPIFFTGSLFQIMPSIRGLESKNVGSRFKENRNLTLCKKKRSGIAVQVISNMSGRIKYDD